MYKPGEKYFVERHCGTLSLVTAERLTKSSVYCDDGSHYLLKNGRLRGGSSWITSYLRTITPELTEQYKRQRLEARYHNSVKKMTISKVSTDKLKKLVILMEEIQLETT